MIDMRKNKNISMTMGILAAMTAGMLAVSVEAQDLHFDTEALIVPSLSAACDLSAFLEMDEIGEDTNIQFTTYDENVAEVDEDGVLKANGYGVTTVVAYLESDETVSASMDVAVCDLYGTYTGAKIIDAMNCEIAVEITLHEDGTYSYYRAPMVVQMEGGGEMPDMTDEGTFEIQDTKICFNGEVLGEYITELHIEEEKMYLEGKIPTGGAATEMELEKQESEEETQEMEALSETETEDEV